MIEVASYAFSDPLFLLLFGAAAVLAWMLEDENAKGIAVFYAASGAALFAAAGLRFAFALW